MTTFIYECLALDDVCEHNKLDYHNVMDKLCNSDVSFGTNADTLITGEMLDSILETRLNYGEFDHNILISLGS
jgi:hypothetical protein